MAVRDREKLQEELEAAGKTRYVTTEMVEDTIVNSQYHQFGGTTVTVCCLKLRNGFSVIGKSACANPENFDLGLGKRLAYEDAKQQIYSLLAYRLCDEASAGN